MSLGWFSCQVPEGGLITLTFKKGDRFDPRNWRPITLLNVDDKIASRAIAGRLLKVIHFVVADDQTCGVPGRFIGDSVSSLRDVARFALTSGSPVPSCPWTRRKRSIA